MNRLAGFLSWLPFDLCGSICVYVLVAGVLGSVIVLCIQGVLSNLVFLYIGFNLVSLCFIV